MNQTYDCVHHSPVARHAYTSMALAGALACLAPVATAQLAISEIRTDQPGSDVDEYFEITGPAGYSLVDYTYVVIGDGTGGSGVLESAIDLGALQIPSDGVAFVAEASFSLGPVPDLVSVMNFENADNVTHLLVTGFSGTVGADLDADDDGTLDDAPWDNVVDCLSILDSSDSGDLTYCEQSVGPDGATAPVHVYLDGGWQIGPPDPSEGVDTPGSLPVGLAVEVSRFTALSHGTDILLSWTSIGSGDEAGYRIREGNRLIATVHPADATYRGGSGDRQYSHTLYNATPGSHPFSLFLFSRAGTESLLATVHVAVPHAEEMLVNDPFPNPASVTAGINVFVGTQQELEITLSDVIGRTLEIIYSGRALGGQMSQYRIELTGRAPGVYFITVRGRKTSVTKHLIVQR